MFEAKLLTTFLSHYQVAHEPRALEGLTEQVNRRSSSSPLEKLQWIINELGAQNVDVHQASLQQARDSHLPALIFIDLAWMLLERDADGFKLFHPSSGYRSVASLDELPVSVVIWLNQKQTNYQDSIVEKNKSVTSLIKNAVLRKPRWILDVGIATVMVNLFAVISSMFAMQVYDRVVPSLAFDTLYSLVIGILIVYLVDFTLKTTRSKLLDRHSSKIDKEISSDIYEHLTNAQLDALPPQLGTLTAQISGMESIRQFFTSSVVFVLVDLPFSILFLATIYMVGGPVAFVYASFLIFSLAIGYIAQKRSRSLTKVVTMRSNERMGVLVDTIKGAETIKSTGAANRFRTEWNEINDSVSDYSVRQKEISSIATSFSQMLGSLAYAMAIVVGVHLISDGQITMGAMIACSILGGRVLGPVGQAVSYLIQFETVKQSADLVNKFLEIPQDRTSNKSLVFPSLKPRDLVIDSLVFKYAGAQVPQVDIDSLQLHAGERVAILGSIGSGKSTLLKLMSGLYRPTQGLIKTGGADLWSLDPHYLNSSIAYLPQTPDLFKGTLNSNLKLSSGINDTTILQVIETLGLGAIVNQSDQGLDLPISEGGAGLSGGQRQLVGLARIFIRRPTIWVLDEPTASLDPDNQQRVKNALLQTLTPNDILIFATHNPRLAVELATRVIVMDRGKIIKDVPSEAVQVRKKPHAIE